MKIPKPGVDLFLLFFWSSRLRFSVFRGESCYAGPVPYTGLFSLSLFLPGFKMSHTKQPFFQYHPSPTEPHGRTFFSLTVFSTGVGFVRGAICRWCDMVLFPYYIKCAESPLEEDKFECGLLGPISHPISTIACSSFCISRWWLISQRWILVFLLRVMTDRRWNAPTLSTTPQKAFEKKATSILLREFRISGTKKAPC